LGGLIRESQADTEGGKIAHFVGDGGLHPTNGAIAADGAEKEGLDFRGLKSRTRTSGCQLNVLRGNADVSVCEVLQLISPVSYSPQPPEVSTPSPRPTQAPVAQGGGDTVNFSAQALAGAIVDAQLSGALTVPQA
jgi:hypothetical protein